MLRFFTNSISHKNLSIGIFGHENAIYGDPNIVNKSISIFVDYIPNEKDFEYSSNHFLVYTKKNSDFEKYIREYGHRFGAILSFIPCENTYENCVFLSAEPYTEENILSSLKEIIIQIIDENQIPENTYWSQQMEDKWIHENIVLPDNGFFLDIGACYAKIISNTYFFEKTLGWNGLAIEPDLVYFADLKKHRNCILENVAISPSSTKAWYKPKVGIVQAKEEDSVEIDCVRLDYLLEKHSIQQIDLISIDIEGYEEIAWSTFDYKKYNPKIIITEHTEFGKYDASFTEKILKDADYYIAHTTPLNYILVNKNVQRKK